MEWKISWKQIGIFREVKWIIPEYPMLFSQRDNDVNTPCCLVKGIMM